MSAVLTSPETICNAALTAVGWTGGFIANMYDGTVQSNAALAVYGNVRDSLLRSFEWGFAEINAPLTLLKTAPVFGYSQPSTTSSWTTSYPMLPWIYEYQYPADCVKLRSIRPQNPVLPVFDPAPQTFRIADDNTLTSSNTKVILTNLASAYAVYTGQVTNPALWDDGFTDAMITGLSERLGPLLKGGLQQQQLEMQDNAQTTGQAERLIG
jgi:hypothetical protein